MSPYVIIYLLDQPGKTLIDSISGEYEDSFCLESFQDLAKAYSEVEPIDSKSLIIARVASGDPKQPTKVAYN
jgi:hypothetical protein